MTDYTGMPWMTQMAAWKGEAEATGTPPTDFDKMVFSHTNFGSLGNEMEAGCAATACAALEITGYKSPHSAAAISFADYGTSCDLSPGCILVFQWSTGGHHVTFCDSIVSPELVTCLGGNQGSEVKDSSFPTSAIIATRWPVKE
jgi:hypothetical protein